MKALVSRHKGGAAAKASGLAAHVAYLGRQGAGAEGSQPSFFDGSCDALEPSLETRGWSSDRHHFRFIISPEHGDRLADLRRYTRDVMRRVADDLGEPELKWLAVCHYDTDQPHAHVLVRGRRSNGRDLVIPRAYIGYGLRARAQETAQELLGDLSRTDAERRIWRETQADRFTGFDRRLLASASADGFVQDGVGPNGAWAALTRGRLRRLAALGLAERHGSYFRLDRELEAKLRTLALKRDVIRTIQQRRLESRAIVQEATSDRLRGRVVRVGAHDELGRSPFVVVRDADGVENYARLSLGHAPVRRNSAVELHRGSAGTYQLEAGRDLGELGR